MLMKYKIVVTHRDKRLSAAVAIAIKLFAAVLPDTFQIISP